MSKSKYNWGTLLKNYYANKVSKPTVEYDEVLNKMYGEKSENHDEETYNPSHIVIDEQAEKYVEEHIIDDQEQLIETDIDAYEAAVVDGGQPIELQETQETHLDDGPTLRPVDEPIFTAEELEEFMRLNGIDGIEELHENNEPNHVELDPNEVVVTEQPTETKVKKVKVSKPKATKAIKSPRGPKAKK